MHFSANEQIVSFRNQKSGSSEYRNDVEMAINANQGAWNKRKKGLKCCEKCFLSSSLSRCQNIFWRILVAFASNSWFNLSIVLWLLTSCQKDVQPFFLVQWFTPRDHQSQKNEKSILFQIYFLLDKNFNRFVNVNALICV